MSRTSTTKTADQHADELDAEARRLEQKAQECKEAARALRHAALLARGETRRPRIGRAPAGERARP